jgi:predicted dehydrogenase
MHNEIARASSGLSRESFLMPRKSPKGIGLAIVGAGRVGLFRGAVAARHPAVEWIGLAEIDAEKGRRIGAEIGADFVTTSHSELLKRPEVTAVIVATDEHLHVDPVMAALERDLPMLIEKPLATHLDDSARVLREIEASGVDAVVGYTQRFRRRWLAAKEKVRTGALGDVTMVTSRAFMNRLVAIDNYRRSNAPETISPMVISGTHALDIVMWYLEAKTPVEVYARSVDKVLGPDWRGIDGTAGMIMMSDGSLYHLNISWALPVTWPGAVYSLEVGIVGTSGVLTIDDTHRDIVLAVSAPQEEGYLPDRSRLVDFMGSYPPGDMALGELRGPMRTETESWLNRIALDLPTQHATAAEAHNRLMLTKALDLSARLKRPVKLPLEVEGERELMREAAMA